MADNLLVFLQPAVDLVPIKRRMSFKSGGIVDGVHVSPDRVLFTAVADLQMPIPRFALVRANRVVRAFSQEVGTYISKRKIRNRQMLGLEHEKGF